MLRLCYKVYIKMRYNNVITRITKILYVKWVKGECRHLCCLCKYKNMCYDNLE